MYTEQDLSAIRAQQKKRWRIVMIPAVLLLIVVIASLCVRLEWLTTSATIVLGIVLIFSYDMLIKPLRCYERHVDDALHGRTHDTEGTYGGMAEDISVVEGVRYYAMTLIQQDEQGEPVERLFYYDAQKPAPDIPHGTPVRITYHDREIISLSLA